MAIRTGSPVIDGEGDYLPVNPPAKTTATTTDSNTSRRWTKAGVVETDDGPVDVDARGKAADGSIPIPATKLITEQDSEDSEDVKPKLISTYTDPETGDIIDVYDDDTEVIRKKGTVRADAATAAATTAAERLAERVSAYDILYQEFKDLGLESLVSDIKDSIINSQSKSERILALRSSKAYATRFGANAKRVANGFKAIDEATYLGLEDEYQSILQNYGMPAKYYTRGELGVQQYLAEAIAKNIDPVTFEERIMEGQKVVNANKEVFDAAKQFFPTLTDSDFLDYVLNPENALSDIKRKVTAAEIGGAQMGAGLQATLTNAEQLAKAGITGAQYQAAAPTISEASIRGGQLASIYREDPYTQQTAEQAVLNTPGSAEAIRRTKKLAGLETAAFSGQSGRGAIDRERAGQI
jgi:hypothetical protein